LTPAGTPADRLRSALDRIHEETAGRPRTARSHDDAAAGARGTIDGDDAVGFDPLPLLSALADHGARAVVIGQVAGILHGSEEPTGDLDLLWSGSSADADAMVAAFTSLGASLTDDDGNAVPSAGAFSLPKVQFRTATAAGDCCTPRVPFGEGLNVATFVDRAVEARIEGVTVRYLAIEDLIAMRRAAGRPKDHRRADELERIVARSHAGGTSP
jgi:hypothetical protein